MRQLIWCLGGADRIIAINFLDEIISENYKIKSRVPQWRWTGLVLTGLTFEEFIPREHLVEDGRVRRRAGRRGELVWRGDGGHVRAVVEVGHGRRQGGRETACHGQRRVTECRCPSLSHRRVSGTRVNTARLSGTSLKSDRSKSRAARASRSQRVQRGPPRAVKYSLATPTRRARPAREWS